jgi:2'-5' RNA ligase
MRLFVAIQLSEEIRKSLIGTMHDLKQAGIKGNYSPAANLHVTLAFIGETRQSDEVKKALQRVEFSPFKLSVREMGTFGDRMWAGVKGNQGLKGLSKDIRAHLEAAEIPYDTKEFVPHITLVRKASGTLPKSFKGPKGEMMVKGFSLMKSEMKNGKRVYTEICHFGK